MCLAMSRDTLDGGYTVLSRMSFSSKPWTTLEIDIQVSSRLNALKLAPADRNELELTSKILERLS